MSKFSDAEINVVNAALAELADHGGKSVSDWSHEEWAGWRISRDGEEISYGTVILASKPGPARTVERLRQRVLSGKWD